MDAKRNGLRDYVKANRRASREAEIENHARPVSFSRVHKSKKVYDRKKLKADDKRHLPSSFPGGNKQAGAPRGTGLQIHTAGMPRHLSGDSQTFVSAQAMRSMRLPT